MQSNEYFCGCGWRENAIGALQRDIRHLELPFGLLRQRVCRLMLNIYYKHLVQFVSIYVYFNDGAFTENQSPTTHLHLWHLFYVNWSIRLSVRTIRALSSSANSTLYSSFASTCRPISRVYCLHRIGYRCSGGIWLQSSSSTCPPPFVVMKLVDQL